MNEYEWILFICIMCKFVIAQQTLIVFADENSHEQKEKISQSAFQQDITDLVLIQTNPTLSSEWLIALSVIKHIIHSSTLPSLPVVHP